MTLQLHPKTSLLLAAFLLVALLTMPAFAGPADSPVLLELDPAAGSHQVGEPFTVEVRVANVNALYGADIRLGFDPSLFAVVDANPASPGVQIVAESEILSPDLVVRREADNQLGTIWYAATQLNPREPASGSGVLFSFQLRALHEGAGLVTFTQTQLTTRDAELISVGSKSGARYWTGSTRYDYAFPLWLRSSISPGRSASNAEQAGRTLAPAATAFTLAPASATIHGCEIIEVEVRIEDVADLYGAEVRLAFDPAVIEVVDADALSAGIQVLNGGLLQEPIFASENEADNTAGTIHFAATQLYPTAPASGTGALIVIKLRARSEGVSDLEITFTRMANRDTDELAGTATDGLVTTVAPSSPLLAISKLNPTTARLSWAAVLGVYGLDLFRDPAPYFTPSLPPFQSIVSPLLSYDDATALGDVVTNYYYVGKSVCENGFAGAIDNRVGEFDYPLLAGLP